MITDFNYWLTGRGWAEAFFSSDRENIRFELSYLSDPLMDLFEALVKLIKGQSDREKVVFLDEPGQQILIISKQKGDMISVEIFWSDTYDEIGHQYNVPNKIEILYTDTDTLKNFASVVSTGIDSLLGRHTLADYKEKWHTAAFPTESYDNLKQTIKMR